MTIPKMTPGFLQAADDLYARPDFRLRETGDAIERRIGDLGQRDGHLVDGDYVLTVVNGSDTYDLILRKRDW